MKRSKRGLIFLTDRGKLFALLQVSSRIWLVGAQLNYEKQIKMSTAFRPTLYVNLNRGHLGEEFGEKEGKALFLFPLHT